MLLTTNTYTNNILTNTVQDTERTNLISYIWEHIEDNQTTIEGLLNKIFTHHDNYGYNSCQYLKPMYYEYALTYVSLIQMYVNKYIKQASITATTISIDATTDPDTILDSASGFVAAGFLTGMVINISGASNNYNNHTFTITAVAIDTLSIAGNDILVDEIAGHNITITGYYPSYDTISGIFNIPTMNERFAKNGISLNSIANSFNLPFNLFNI